MASRAESGVPHAARLLALALGASLWWGARGLEPWAVAAWLAPVPALVLATRDRWRGALGIAVAAHAVGGLSLWPYLTGALYLPVPIAIAAVGVPSLVVALHVAWFRALARRYAPWVTALGAGALAAALDLAAARLSIHGSFGSLAYTQLTLLPIAQLAALGGTPLIVGVMVMVSAAVALGASRSGTVRQQQVVWALAVGSVVLAGAGGAVRLARAPNPTRTLRVALLATDTPDAPQDGASDAGRALLARYEQALRALPAGGDNVIVLPERSVELEQGALDSLLQHWGALATERATAIVLGASGGRDPARNTAWYFAPGAVPRPYFKRHLLPPFESRFTPGDSAVVVHPAGALPLGLMICKDGDFAEWGRAYARQDIAALLMPAWDFGADGWLHARMAMLRGIEGGYAVVRSARRGRLTVSDAYGRVLAEARSDAAPMAMVRAAVPLVEVHTPYARFGDAFGLACGGVVLVLAAAMARKRLVGAGRGRDAGWA